MATKPDETPTETILLPDEARVILVNSDRQNPERRAVKFSDFVSGHRLKLGAQFFDCVDVQPDGVRIYAPMG